MHKKHLLKAKKKACLKAKKAGDNKDASNDKDASPFAPTIAISPGFLASIAAYLSLFTLAASSSSALTPASIIPSSTNAIGASVSICLFFFYSCLAFSFFFSRSPIE